MIELTGFKDIDNIIYDFKYGCRVKPNQKPYRKVVKELNDVLYGYYYGAGTLKARHEPTYFKHKPKIHRYLKKIAYNNIWNIDNQHFFDYRIENQDDIIYL